MITRLLSGIALAAAVLALLLWAPPAWALAVVAVVILTGAWEWSAFLRPTGLGERVVFVAVVVALALLAWQRSADPVVLRAVLWVAAAWWLVALGWVFFGPRAVNRAMAWLAGILVLVPAAVALGRLRIGSADGASWTLYALVLVWAADTGAYFAGRAFGRHKLAPLVSPGKTWEGVAGGIVLVAVWAAVGARWLGVPALPLLSGSVVIAVFSVVGDLTESLMKRHAGLKDSGHVIPGHGGVMDRIDSITAAAPLLLLLLLESLPT